jgi:histidine triad (HIT) family protein
MSECIFCSIAGGIVPAHVVHESVTAIAFLDRFPAARGHVLVIPRHHAPTLLDLPDEAVGALFQEVKVVTRAVSEALRPLAFHVGWNHGFEAGQRVFHLHVHVIPRYAPGGAGIQSLGTGPGRDDLDATAAAIRDRLGGPGQR